MEWPSLPKTWQDAIIDYKKNNAAERGIDPNTAIAKKPSLTTGSRYQHLQLLLDPKATAVSTAIKKSDSRQIAERSLMSATAFACTVLTTSYHLAGPNDVPFKVPDTCPKGCHLAYHLIKEAYGGADLVLVSPFLLTSTDDFNTFIFKGIVEENNKDKLMIISKQAYKGRGSHSIYNKEETTKSKNGLRVKLGTTGTAAGQTAPPYIVISGLTEKDMPEEDTPDGVLIMEIPKLSVGGLVDPDNKGVGFIVFICSDGTNDASVNLVSPPVSGYI